MGPVARLRVNPDTGMRPPTLNERVPFLATQAATAYDRLRPLPVVVALDNVRSLYNVGAFFRTADAVGLEKLYLCGITGRPPNNAIAKTALGAEQAVRWEYSGSAEATLGELRGLGYELAAIETAVCSLDLYDWRPRFPVCLVFGHETDGIRPEIARRCDTFVRIPMLGAKHSLNVATAGGVALYELLRKYRELFYPQQIHAGRL